MKQLKRIINYLAWGLFFPFLTVYNSEKDVNLFVIISEGIIFYTIFVFINTLIIKRFYLKTKSSYFIKIVIGIVVGISLFMIGRFFVSSIAIYELLVWIYFL